MKDLIKESRELKDNHKKKETAASCEELVKRIDKTRILLGHIRDVKSECARQTYVSLNKDLLLLWKEFFKRYPKMAKEYLRKCARVGL